ncbi:MAG TPA: VOC family protein [Noviherbaspirillum sp.]
MNLDVDDLERALAFYLAALPLRLERRLFGGTVAELGGASARIYLLQKEAGSVADRAGNVRNYRRHWTPVHLDFVVADLDVALARAEAAGALRESGPQAFKWGRMATLSDPCGHGFCLLQFVGGIYEGT